MVRMRRLSFWAVCAVLAGGSAWAGPRLETGPRTVDFGPQLRFREVEFPFTLKNTGTSPLEVSIEKASCGCTTQVLTGETIGPGKSSEMLLTYRGKKERKKTGDQSFVVELATNDPENPIVVLTARVKLVDQVYIEPEVIELGEETDAKPLRVICMDYGGMPEILSVEPAIPCVSIEKTGVERQERREAHEYLVRRSASAPAGECFSIVVKTSSIRTPVVEVPVKLVTKPLFDAKPERLLFGVIKGGAVVEKQVALTASGDPPKGASCASSHAAVVPTLVRGAGTSECLLTAKLEAPQVSEVETIKAEIVLRDDASRWLCTVPVIATVAP